MPPSRIVDCLQILLWLFATAHLCTSQYSIQRQDPFALLFGTLQTYQRAACDGEELNLDCPANTTISIQFVQYGRTRPSSQVCGPTSDYPLVYGESESFKCSFPEALKFIEKKCQGKEECSMSTAPELFGAGPAAVGQTRDPCPRYRKYVEVAYKCKPLQFKLREVCQGKYLNLACSQPDERIAIYSATLNSTSGSHLYCQQPTGIKPQQPQEEDDDTEEGVTKDAQMMKCESSSVTETVMSKCHGKSKCEVLADSDTLGVPACKFENNINIKCIYACANKNIFKDEFRDDITTTIATTTTTTTTTTITTTTMTKPSSTPTTPQNFSSSSGLTIEIRPPLQKGKDSEDELPVARDSVPGPSQVQHQEVRQSSNNNERSEPKPDDKQEVQGAKDENAFLQFFADLFSSMKHIQDNKSKFILFLSLTIGIGLILLVAMAILGMYRSRRLTRIAQRLKRPKSDPSSLAMTNGDSLPINAFSYGGGDRDSPPRGLDIEVEIGESGIHAIHSGPDSPLKHQPMGNAIYPLAESSTNFGTIRKRDSQTYGGVPSLASGFITINSRPRNETRFMCDAETDTQYQPQKRVQFPPEDYIDNHQHFSNTMWNPNPYNQMIGQPNKATNSSISGSVRDESPAEVFPSSPTTTSPLLQINQYQLNDPYGQQQRFHSYNHNNNLMVPNQSPVHHHTLPYPDQQTVRYSTICRQGRIPPSHSYQGPSPVRSVVIVAPGDPPLSPNTTANLMAQRESRLLSRANQMHNNQMDSDTPRIMTLSRISPKDGDQLFYG